MKLVADWLTDPATVTIMTLLTQDGHGAWFVGGCVRNALLGRGVEDIDIATDLRPDDVMALAQAAGIKAVPTGIAHGTVTLIVDHRPFEVTTLRRDVATDGRRATIAFTDHVDEDAARRDFTINALYAQADGTVLDPTGEGLADIQARRLRFIGDPRDRITEDYLRILRFFRFHAWYADPIAGIDSEGLAACAALADGLGQLSRERVGAEIKKLLGAPDPAPVVAAMAQAGILARTLPGAMARMLPILIAFEDAPPDPIRRLAALGDVEVAAGLRLANAEITRLSILRDGMSSATPPDALAYLHGADIAWDIVVLRASQFETPVDPTVRALIARGASAVFPVKPADLMPRLSGAALGQALKTLEARWIASSFTLGRAELLSRLPQSE
ncbi:CCA tRNA nucleotidyltransferase [Roseicyclus sp.]|uniref:CCA tRNA nucleotidyltransferase n=1 Tax=Roseicyclus sp. TaxID=1914329 RepID=UPI003F6AA741